MIPPHLLLLLLSTFSCVFRKSLCFTLNTKKNGRMCSDENHWLGFLISIRGSENLFFWFYRHIIFAIIFSLCLTYYWKWKGNERNKWKIQLRGQIIASINFFIGKNPDKEKWEMKTQIYSNLRKTDYFCYISYWFSDFALIFSLQFSSYYCHIFPSLRMDLDVIISSFLLI